METTDAAVAGGECKCMPDANHSLTPPDVINNIPNDSDDTSEDSHQCMDQTAQYYIAVYRLPEAPVACDEYLIEFSNGINQNENEVL